MRIIGGTLKGRKFYPPADKWPTRPTTDYAKEGLYNILQNRIDFEETRMLDLFGGTGNQSFEAISRGCQDVTYVDKHRPAVRFAKQTAAEFDIADSIKVITMDVKRFIKINHDPWDYIFAGPPYPLPWLDQIPNLVFENKLVAEYGLFVLEHNPKHNFEEHPNFKSIRSYGQTKFSFFKNILEKTTD